MFRSPRNAVAVALIFALVAGFFVAGHYLYKLPIGLEQSAFLWGEPLHQFVSNVFLEDVTFATSGLALLVLVLLGIGAVAYLLVRSAVRNRVAEVDPGRRTFLTGAGFGWLAALGSIIVAGAAGAARGLLGWGVAPRGWADVNTHIQADVVKTHPEWKTAWKGSRVQSYRRFGRTDWQVSDVVLGTGRIRGEDGEKIARLAIDRGVNYFDTSPDYSGAGSEQAMGRAIKGVRDKLFIATKFCSPTGHLPAGAPVQRYKEVVEASLGRLGTDYVDLCHIHACDSVDRLMDPNAHEAFDRLKEEGKVRFLGVSSHTPNLVEVANTAVDSGRFDVMMLAYHHGMWAPLNEIISRGHSEQDMGIVAMKTLKGAKHHGLEGFQEEADAFSQAALKWVLSNPDVSCAVISFFELQHVDEYLYASGKSVTPRDLAILRKYDREIVGTYCAPHCGACLGTCTADLSIHDILRYRMYFEDYGWEKEGMRLYSQLEKNASVCAGCSAPCLGSCPTGIPIQERLVGTHELLTLS